MINFHINLLVNVFLNHTNLNVLLCEHIKSRSIICDEKHLAASHLLINIAGR